MNIVKPLAAVVLCLAVPVIARAGPTLYDMQHSSVLRQRLPPYLRKASDAAPARRDSDRKPAARAHEEGKAAAPSGAPGAGKTQGDDGNAGK